MATRSRITFEVDSRRGAKITSLRDSSGREWLTRARRADVQPGLNFGFAEMAGWDECAPTIERCVVDGKLLPDHGDAWDVEWKSDGQGLRHEGASWPYVLRRRIVEVEHGLRLDYAAEALGQAVPLLWTAHPQFAAPPGTRVELSPAPRRVVAVDEDGARVVGWDPALAMVDGLPTGGSRKLHVHPDEQPVTRATLVHADGARLTLTFADPCVYLAIWVDNQAYADQPTIALEPSIAFGDSLARAIDLGRAPLVLPGLPLEWSVTITAD